MTEARRRSRRKETRPGDLLQAALELFVEKGFAATRVEEVAQRAGVSKGTLFLYFKSKEELLQAVVRENISGRFDDWQQLLGRPDTSLGELIPLAVHDWWERIGQTKAAGITKLMLCEGQNFPELAQFYRREVVERGTNLVRELLRQGVARGEFRADLDVDCAGYALLAPMLQLALMRHCVASYSDPHVLQHPERYLAAQIDVMLHGLLNQRGAVAAPERLAAQPDAEPVKAAGSARSTQKTKRRSTERVISSRERDIKQ